MPTPGEQISDLYRTDPRLTHAAIDFEPRLRSILSGLIVCYMAVNGDARPPGKLTGVSLKSDSRMMLTETCDLVGQQWPVMPSTDAKGAEIGDPLATGSIRSWIAPG